VGRIALALWVNESMRTKSALSTVRPVDLDPPRFGGTIPEARFERRRGRCQAIAVRRTTRSCSRGSAAASFIGVVGVVSYLTSPNTGRDLRTALAMALAVVAVVVVLLALRWLAVRPRQ